MQQEPSAQISPTPEAQIPQNSGNLEANNSQNFAGFWKRVAVLYADMAIIFLLATLIHPATVLFPLLINIILYFWKGMTIGDYIMQTKLVKYGTSEKPSGGQLIGRFFAKILSAIPLNLGFLWAGWTKEKKAWHDSMSGTRYVETKSYNGGLTWLANILLLVAIPYFTMQPVISFVAKTLVPIGQGIFEGNPEKELEGINSFGDILENAARKQMKESGKIGEIKEEIEGKKTTTTNYKKPIPAPLIKKKKLPIEKTPIKEVLIAKKEVEKDNIMIEISKNYKKNSVEVFRYDFFKDDYRLVSSADPKTFEVLSAIQQDNWAKDKNNVYYNGYIVSGADSDSFKLLSKEFRENNWAYDASSVFYLGKLVAGASPNFLELAPGNNDGYKYWARNKNVVMFKDKIVKNADPDSFEVIDGSSSGNDSERWGKDKNFVFFEDDLLNNSDPDSFFLKEDGSAEDKNNTYDFRGKITKK